MRRGRSDDCRPAGGFRDRLGWPRWGCRPRAGPGGMPPPPPPTLRSSLRLRQRAPPPAPPAPAVVAGAAAGRTPRVESDFDVQQRRWASVTRRQHVRTGSRIHHGAGGGPAVWLSPSTGVDVALGIGWTGGSTDTAGMSTDKNAVFGILFQGGVPFVLAGHRHVNFEVIPSLTVGYGRTSTGMNYGYMTETDYNGLRLDVGARAGFEVFFGFIGIPELALSATSVSSSNICELVRVRAASMRPTRRSRSRRRCRTTRGTSSRGTSRPDTISSWARR